MFYLLDYERVSSDIIEACGSVGIAGLLNIVKTILSTIQIIGPILCMVALAINFIKLMTNPEEKKYKPIIKNCIMALVILFMVPFIVNLVMSLADESFNLAKCWNNAESVVKLGEESNYVDTSGKQPQSILPGTSGNLETEESSQSNTSTQIKERIFVGDSRTVGMQSAVGGNDIWSSKSSIGLDWMRSTGIPNIEANIKEGTALIILLGVNDLYQANNYISYLNMNAPGWVQKGAKVYFVSVNPTDGNYDYLNTDINNFNQNLKQGLISDIKYIDSNSHLKSVGFQTTDGLHYTADTYQEIYNYIINNL